MLVLSERNNFVERKLSPSISPPSARFPSPRFELSAPSSQTLIDVGRSTPLSLSRQITSRSITLRIPAPRNTIFLSATDISLHFFAKGDSASSFAARDGWRRLKEFSPATWEWLPRERERKNRTIFTKALDVSRVVHFSTYLPRAERLILLRLSEAKHEEEDTPSVHTSSYALLRCTKDCEKEKNEERDEKKERKKGGGKRGKGERSCSARDDKVLIEESTYKM